MGVMNSETKDVLLDQIHDEPMDGLVLSGFAHSVLIEEGLKQSCPRCRDELRDELRD